MPTKKAKKKAPAKKKPAAAQPARAKRVTTQLAVDAFQTKAQRTVNTMYGPKVALPGEWILDLGEGCYAIATDAQVQRLRKG